MVADLTSCPRYPGNLMKVVRGWVIPYKLPQIKRAAEYAVEARKNVVGGSEDDCSGGSNTPRSPSESSWGRK